MITYTATNNNQTLTYTARTAQEQGLFYANLQGRPARLVRASMNAVLARVAKPQVFPEFISEEYIAEAKAQNLKDQSKAEAMLARIADLDDAEIVWEDATWHSTRALAESAQRRSKAFANLIVEVTE